MLKNRPLKLVVDRILHQKHPVIKNIPLLDSNIQSGQRGDVHILFKQRIIPRRRILWRFKIARNKKPSVGGNDVYDLVARGVFGYGEGVEDLASHAERRDGYAAQVRNAVKRLQPHFLALFKERAVRVHHAAGFHAAYFDLNAFNAVRADDKVVSVLRFLRRFVRRVGRKAGGENDAHGNAEHDDPERRFFPPRKVSHALFRVAFAESERRERDNAPPCRKLQKRCGIVGKNVAAELFHDSLVAAHLHVARRADERDPCKRIEPVQRERRERKHLYDVVAASDVMPLVEEDVFIFLLTKLRGEIYPRPQQPHNKGRGDAVGKEDILPQRRSGQKPPPQPQIRRAAVDRHRQNAAKPDIRSRACARLFCLRHSGRCGVLRLHLGRQAAKRRGRRGDGRVLRRSIRAQRRSLLRRRIKGGKKRHVRLDGNGAEQSEKNRRPQNVGEDLRRFPQEKPRRQHE